MWGAKYLKLTAKVSCFTKVTIGITVVVTKLYSGEFGNGLELCKAEYFFVWETTLHTTPAFKWKEQRIRGRHPMVHTRSMSGPPSLLEK